jgi:hypothetical protein
VVKWILHHSTVGRAAIFSGVRGQYSHASPRGSSMTQFLSAGALLALLALAPLAHGQAAVQRIRGDVAAVHGKDLDVRTHAGQVVTVRMSENLRVSARGPADLGSIAPGSFIGTTAVAQPDGTLQAVEVHVYPESMRGRGEGHRPMDTEPASTMTNATVTSVAPAAKAAPRSTMTNATVQSVTPTGSARRLTLAYKGGEQTVIVGENVPVVTVEPGDRSMLVPGAHVVVTAAKQLDGTLTTDRILVGKNGVAPPI